jgi:hypothetical protein
MFVDDLYPQPHMALRQRSITPSAVKSFREEAA